MRTVADNLRMLRDFDDSGDVIGWVPVTHRIWDYEHLGCVLYIDRGVSVTADVSEGTGELDAVTVVGKGFTAMVCPWMHELELFETGFGYADRSGTMVMYLSPSDPRNLAPTPPEDNLDPSGWGRGASRRLMALAECCGSDIAGESEVVALGGGMTVEVFRGEPDDDDCPPNARVVFDDDSVLLEFKGLLCPGEGSVIIDQSYSSVEIRLPAGGLSRWIVRAARRLRARIRFRPRTAPGVGHDLHHPSPPAHAQESMPAR